MKKLFLLIALFLCFLFPKSSFAATDYVIESFDSNILIMQDTTVSVTETIRAKFLYDKHGIIRTLPVIYSAHGRAINSHLVVTSVTDENDVSYNYTTSRVAQSIQLKIGDPDKTLKGSHTYKIGYRLRGVILTYDNNPEFYWNVTGHEWDTEILSAKATVSSLHAPILDIVCYTGLGSVGQQNCEKNFDEKNAIFTTSTILPGNDFTIATKFSPTNSLVFPSAVSRTSSNVWDNWGYATAVVPFLLILFLWYKRGRDDKFVGDNFYYKPDNPKTQTSSLFRREHIPLVYHPLDGLTPAQVGTILDERIDINDIVAEIVELARLKYLKIAKLPKKGLLSKQDYSITKLKNDESKLTDYQKEILKELFRSPVKLGSVYEIVKLIEDQTQEEKELKEMVGKDYITLSSLKNHFYVALPRIKSKVYKSLADTGVFDGNPDTVRVKYILGYFIVAGIFGVMTFTYATWYNNFFPILLVVIGDVVGFVFAFSMPKKTAWGFSLNRQVLGLREYLKLGKWRHEHYENKLFFEEMIPLAISLGVIDKLARDMNELGMQPPRYMSGFAISHFASDMNAFRSTAASTFVSAPGGSGKSSWGGGSGFSGGGGGGFGGGGGGSW